MKVADRLKDSLFRLATLAGANAAVRRALRSRLRVVCYHGVVGGDRSDDAYRYRNTVSVAQFRRQLATLSRHFSPVSAGDVLDWVERGTRLPDSAVLVTFDDGYRNNLVHALPELERYGVPALVSVTTGYIGQRRLLWTQEVNERVLQTRRPTLPLPADGGSAAVPDAVVGRIALAERIRGSCKALSRAALTVYLGRLSDACAGEALQLDDELYNFLSWDEVRALARRGVAIASHTVEHPILSRLDRDALVIELQESRATIERELGTACPWIAYPNGGFEDISADVISVARESGYRVGFSLTGRVNSAAPDPLMIDRICIVGHVPDPVFDVRISGLHGALARG